MNRIYKSAIGKKCCSVYFTAGYPAGRSVSEEILALEKNGADLVEIGLPFSDPLADGPVIQHSSQIALQHGMNADRLFDELEGIRMKTNIPLLIMTYFNAVYKYGVEKFLLKCECVGIDGLIIPDLPFEVFRNEYENLFRKCKIELIFLITTETSKERIEAIDAASNGFIYLLSSSSTTGKSAGLSPEQLNKIRKVCMLRLKNPVLVGFGIQDSDSFNSVCSIADGAIIGSAYIRAQERGEEEEFLKLLTQNINSASHT